MTVIVCVDERGGILFNHRRVSSDRAVIADILEYAGDRPLRIREYSAKLFPEEHLAYASPDYLLGAQIGDIVFLEDAVPEDIFKEAERIVVYHWNRLYPSDVKFPLDRLRRDGRLESTVEFAGSSHDKITREVYAL